MHLVGAGFGARVLAIRAVVAQGAGRVFAVLPASARVAVPGTEAMDGELLAGQLHAVRVIAPVA